MLKTLNTILIYSIAVLFSYAFFIKIQNFENFVKKLFQSELIANNLVSLVSYTVPSIEIIIAMCLLFSIKRKVFLYISMFVLIVFTSYLFTLNEYSLFNGCSCGGVFENISYTQHTIINLVFIFFNLLAILTIHSKTKVIGELLPKT